MRCSRTPFFVHVLSFAVHMCCVLRSCALHATFKPVFCPVSNIAGKRQFCTPSLPRFGGTELWTAAVKEAGLNPDSISEFGKLVPKYTAAEVKSIMQLEHSKTHEFNFQGSLCRDTDRGMKKDPAFYRKRRHWVIDFALANFSAFDVLYIQDGAQCGIHERLGPYDFSEHAPNHVDGGYYQALARSKFTLTPGGDQAWSARVWEAVAAKSLPLIASLEGDWAPEIRGGMCLFNQYYYSTTNNPIYNESWVEHNFRAFIRYQTFMEGDNVPPGCK